MLKRNNKKIIIPSPIVLNQDYLISDLANKIIREFNLDPEKAKKKDIEKVYTTLYQKLENECKESKTKCKQQKDKLTKNYNLYNDPKSNCF